MKKLLIITLLFFSMNLLYSQSNLIPNGYNRLYYHNGTLQSEGTLLDGKPEGFWINYYPTGVVKSEGRRTNHVLDSIWIFYNLVGDTVSKINYLNGSKNGYYYKYVERPQNLKGNISSKELYVNDKLEGEAYYYFNSGKVKEIALYRNNKREGKSYEFAEEGRLITIYTYRKGSISERIKLNRYNELGGKIGLWQDFYDGYRLRTESYYKNGLLNGYYKEYDSKGNLTLTLFYRDGKLIEQVNEEAFESIERQEFFEDGSASKTGSYINDKPVGIHKEYSRDGNIVMALIYDDNHKIREKGEINNEGYKEDEWEEFYTNGLLKAKGKYIDNLKSGVWNYYFENGKIEQEGSYSKGRYTGIWKWYYASGELWKEEEFFNGKEEGYYYEYSKDGTVLIEGEYFDGEKEGKWKTLINDYSAEGSYINGFMNGKWKHYHDNGSVAFEGNYIQGNADGKHRYFYSNGTLKEEQYFNNGLKQKHWKKFNENGELIITITYVNNVEYRINGIRIDFPKDIIKAIE